MHIELVTACHVFHEKVRCTVSKPRLLDLFCGAGGAAMGYARAGFEVVGVDIVPQPRYPFPFMQADAMTFSFQGFDAVHASPPCQAYSRCQRFLKRRDAYPDLLPRVRERLSSCGVPWILENVVGAPMPAALVLCGTMFGLNVLRHRLFESSHVLFAPSGCAHRGVTQEYGGTYVCVAGNMFRLEDARHAMGIEWMTSKELSQAIPPAYTSWLGCQLKEVCDGKL
jgi:DNA (cytosine-5)-methyltransferase 1